MQVGKERLRPHGSPSWEVGQARIQGNSRSAISAEQSAFTRKMDSAFPWPPCLHPLSSLGLPRHSEPHREAHCVPGSTLAWLTPAPSLRCSWGILVAYG